jgi:hypothetical protein
MEPRSLDLLDRALKTQGSERGLSRALGLASNTLSTARAKGHLSPAIAALIASHLGESPTQAARWCLLAVCESDHNEKVRPQLQQIVAGLKSYFSSPRRNRTP